MSLRDGRDSTRLVRIALALAMAVIGWLTGAMTAQDRFAGTVVRNSTMIEVQSSKLDDISRKLEEIQHNLLTLTTDVAALRPQPVWPTDRPVARRRDP